MSRQKWRFGRNMKIAMCPECEGEFRTGPILKVGQRLICPNCDAELEVIHLSPLELDWAFDEPASDTETEAEESWEEEEETWDDEEWEDEEEEWEDEEEDEEEI
jgi:Zn-finger nucleic acid-binding protein